MNKINYIINAVLLVAIIVLFVLFFTQKNNSETTEKPVVFSEGASVLPVAYINTDSLLMKYVFAIEMNEAMLRKQENMRATLNERGRAFEKEVADFRRKVENNAFLSQQRAQDEQTRLARKEQELQQLSQRMTEELMVEQQKNNEQLRDSVNNYIKIFNADKGYQIIFSNTMNDNILVADPRYDITNEIVKGLNKRCSPK